MKKTLAESVSLLMGILSLLAAASAVFAIWLSTIPTQTTPPIPRSNLAQAVRESNSLETLKERCGLWAKYEDQRSDLTSQVLANNRQLLNGVVGGTLIWGMISGIAFFFIYACIRRTSRIGD